MNDMDRLQILTAQIDPKALAAITELLRLANLGLKWEAREKELAELRRRAIADQERQQREARERKKCSA